MSDYVVMRVPKNLRQTWAFPNLQHYNKFIDLLLLSASSDRVGYNRTYVYVPYGNVLLNYTFFSLRWQVSRNTVYSILNVLISTGWIKIKTLKCKTITNTSIKAKFITFPKISLEHSSINIIEQGGEHINKTKSENYKDLTHINGQSGEQSNEQYTQQRFEQCSEQSPEQSSALVTDLNTNNYDDFEYINEQSTEHCTQHLYNIDRLIDRNIKEKNKKEKILNPPKIEEIKEYAFQRNIRNVDLDYFHNFYDNTDWTDSNGEPVKNWKKLLVSISAKIKKNQETNFAYGTKKPSATDKLARQAAELASHYAGTLAGEEK